MTFTPNIGNASPGNGPIAGQTSVFNFSLINFDWTTWHNYEWENWVQVDALLNTAIGFLGLTGIWRPNKAYTVGQSVFDPADINVVYRATTSHTSGTDFTVDQPLYWLLVDEPTPPVISVHGRIGAVVGQEADYSAFYPLKAPTEAHIASTTNPHNTSWSNLLGKPATFAPSAHTHAISEVTNLQTQLDAKAPLASPALTGVPTAPTAAGGTNTTQIATTAFVRDEVAALVASAPGTLDTLNELAAALDDDPNFATTITNLINANTVEIAAKMEFEGVWSPGTYALHDTVTHNNSTWICTAASTTGEPGVSADWSQLGSPGAGRYKGENGEVGNSAGDIFRVHEKTLNTSVTIDADENAVAAGPLTIASGVTLTVTAGGDLAIV